MIRSHGLQVCCQELGFPFTHPHNAHATFLRQPLAVLTSCIIRAEKASIVLGLHRRQILRAEFNLFVNTKENYSERLIDLYGVGFSILMPMYVIRLGFLTN
jgi:hypothetical protein